MFGKKGDWIQGPINEIHVAKNADSLPPDITAGFLVELGKFVHRVKRGEYMLDPMQEIKVFRIDRKPVRLVVISLLLITAVDYLHGDHAASVSDYD